MYTITGIARAGTVSSRETVRTGSLLSFLRPKGEYTGRLLFSHDKDAIAMFHPVGQAEQGGGQRG